MSLVVGICMSFSTGCNHAHKTGGTACESISIQVCAYVPGMHKEPTPQPSFYKIGGAEKIYTKGDTLEYLFNDMPLGHGSAGEKALIAKLHEIKSAKTIKISNPAHWGGATDPAVAHEDDAKYPWILDASNEVICKREIDRIRQTLQNKR